MKIAEDQGFSLPRWIVTNTGEKGWVTHYRPKNPPVSAEIESVFRFLKLDTFAECPHFNFDPCFWRFTPCESRGDSVFDGNADYAHGLFAAHAEHFSPGIRDLLATHALVEPFGLKLLPFQEASPPQWKKEKLSGILHYRRQRGWPPSKAKASSPTPSRDFDVALSFAGTDRVFAEELAKRVIDAGFQVFYDNFYPEELWGKDLVVFFDEVYRKRSRYCVMFISKEYAERMWTNHERRSAQARTLEEKGKEYILPIKCDDTDLPGMPPTVGHLPVDMGIEEIADILIRKLKG